MPRRNWSREAGLQAREYLHPARTAVGWVQPEPFRNHRRLHQDRHADLRRQCRIEPGESRGRHAHNVHRIIVHQNLLAQHVWICVESRLPIVVTQHDHRVALENAVVVLRIENPANRRRDSQHGEVIAGYHFGRDALCLVVNAYRRGHQATAEHFGERRSFLLVVLVDRVGMHAGTHVVSVV